MANRLTFTPRTHMLLRVQEHVRDAFAMGMSKDQLRQLLIDGMSLGRNSTGSDLEELLTQSEAPPVSIPMKVIRGFRHPTENVGYKADTVLRVDSRYVADVLIGRGLAEEISGWIPDDIPTLTVNFGPVVKKVLDI